MGKLIKGIHHVSLKASNEEEYQKLIWREEWNAVYLKSRLQYLAFAMICGLVAHGYIMFSKIPNYDEYVSIFHYGGGYNLGRWFLALMGNFFFRIDGCYSLPWLNGLVTLLFLSLGILLFLEGFPGLGKGSKGLIIMILLAFPSVTTIFSYMFTAPFYAFAIFLAAVGFFLAVKYRYGFLVAPVCLCLSMGIYQAYFVMCATFLLSFLLCMSVSEEKNVKEVITTALKFLVTLAGGMLLYFIVNTIMLRIQHITLSDYQGISGMGNYSVNSLIAAALSTYKGFADCLTTNYKSMFPNPVFHLAGWTGVILTVVCAVAVLRKQVKKQPVKMLLFVVILAIMPLCMNLIHVMCAESIDNIHALMCYGAAGLFFVPILLWSSCVEKGEGTKEKQADIRGNEQKKVEKQFVCKTAFSLHAVCLTIAILFYVKFANTYYLSLELYFDQTYAMMETMAVRIQMTEGYRQDMAVSFGGSYSDIVSPLWEMRDVDLLDGTYRVSHIMNTQLLRDNVFRHYLGQDIRDLPLSEEIRTSQEYAEMPCYPNDGSIRVIEDSIVVKLSDG